MVVLINWVDGSIKLRRSKGAAAKEIGVHRNTLTSVKDRGVIGNWIIVIVEVG